MVLGLVKSIDWGWTSVRTIACCSAAAVVLVAAFVVIERRTAFPLVRCPSFRNRSRAVSNLVSLALGASVFSMFYFLSLYMQQVLGYSASRRASATSCHRWRDHRGQQVRLRLSSPRFARARLIMTTGMLLAAGGTPSYFAQISL